LSEMHIVSLTFNLENAFYKVRLGLVL